MRRCEETEDSVLNHSRCFSSSAHHYTTSTMLYRRGCMLGIICSSLLFSTFLLSHHLDKGSSLSHQSINSSNTLLAHHYALLQTLILPFYFWCWSEVCILLCSICNSVSKSPEDSRLSEHHPSFLEVVGDFTDTSFRVHFHCHQLLLFSQAIG